MELKLFIDRLKQEGTETFSYQLPSHLLNIEEKDLSCSSDVLIEGSAYLAIDHLIIKMNLSTTIAMPCNICNEQTNIAICLPNLYHAVPIEEIRGSIFDLLELVREEILLQIPQFTECEGNCPQRSDMKKYLTSEKPKETNTHFPFLTL